MVIQNISSDQKTTDITFTVKRDDSFFIPNGLFDISEEEVLSTLYVNAWDPWSMVGNGNKGDKSLDGYWGRSSAMVPLCWPKINSEISYELHKNCLFEMMRQIKKKKINVGFVRDTFYKFLTNNI